MVSSIGSYISAFSVLIFLYGVFQAYARKQKAADNPWGEGATTLEWTLSSPPPYPSVQHSAGHPVTTTKARPPQLGGLSRLEGQE